MKPGLRLAAQGLILLAIALLAGLLIYSNYQRGYNHPAPVVEEAPARPSSPGTNRVSQSPPAPGLSGEIKMQQFAMGTTMEYIVLGVEPAAAREAIVAAMGEVDRLAALMTDYQPDSDVSHINRSAGGPPVAVAPEVYEVIERSLAISELSGGGFDITIGPLKGIWTINQEPPFFVPADDKIKSALPLVNWRNVILDPERRAVGLKLPDMRIDLGGIAKGYIVDRALEVLKQHGIKMASVNAGGNVRLMGLHGDRPWNVGIRHPRKSDTIIARIELSDASVATSGDYEKFIEINGRRYGHIIDPHTGVPVSTMQSATVITADACRADGLSTAVFVLGPEKGMALIESLSGVEGVIIDAQGKRTESSGLQGRVNWLK